MQQLLKKLFNHSYIEIHRWCPDTDTVKDIVWAHPASIDLLHVFPRVLIMDCTYKTNRYRLPLMEIVGVASTEMTFFIASPESFILCGRLTERPITGIPTSMGISSSVIVISPNGIWKVFVSGCHRSTNAEITTYLPFGRKCLSKFAVQIDKYTKQKEYDQPIPIHSILRYEICTLAVLSLEKLVSTLLSNRF